MALCQEQEQNVPASYRIRRPICSTALYHVASGFFLEVPELEKTVERLFDESNLKISEQADKRGIAPRTNDGWSIRLSLRLNAQLSMILAIY